MDWKPYAAALARAVVRPSSPWYQPVVDTPRHLYVPAWFTAGPEGWTRTDGPADEEAWARAAYTDQTLVTRVGPHHADRAGPRPVVGTPTSSGTLPSLVVSMLTLGEMREGHRLLEIGTGTGYSSALACARLGDSAVTTVDVDRYLTESAVGRLAPNRRRPVGGNPVRAVVLADGYQQVLCNVYG
ncbi:protein-L-isoaspartate(D-aspartate) O-methyltransferase, partial [Streptomyces sp. NPDC059604]